MNKAEAANAGRALATENDRLRRELSDRDREVERLAGDRDLARAAKDKLRRDNEKLRSELDAMTRKYSVARDMLGRTVLRKLQEKDGNHDGRARRRHIRRRV